MGIPFTDELHLSSTGSVLALLLLAHFAGGRIREYLHAASRRRKEADDARRSQLPKPDAISLGVAGVAIAAAVVLLLGTSSVRADFLDARGVNAQNGSFLAIQIGILMAALGLSIGHAHPYGRALAAGRRARLAAAAMSDQVSEHAELVGRHNALIDRADALLAEAGHHCAIATSDVARQAQMYMRRVQFSQPEPLSKRLFDKQVPPPTEYVDERLAGFLTGIASLPTFARLDTDRITDRRELHRDDSRRCAVPPAPRGPPGRAPRGGQPGRPTAPVRS